METIEVKKMFLHKMNENDENIEYEYLIPASVIEKYIDEHVDEDERTDINTFLNSVYDSEDTDIIIEMCESEDIHYELVGSEVWY